MNYVQVEIVKLAGNSDSGKVLLGDLSCPIDGSKVVPGKKHIPFGGYMVIVSAVDGNDDVAVDPGPVQEAKETKTSAKKKSKVTLKGC